MKRCVSVFPPPYKGVEHSLNEHGDFILFFYFFLLEMFETTGPFERKFSWRFLCPFSNPSSPISGMIYG
jgi:hypothetical protein